MGINLLVWGLTSKLTNDGFESSATTEPFPHLYKQAGLDSQSLLDVLELVSSARVWPVDAWAGGQSPVWPPPRLLSISVCYQKSRELR